MTGQAKIFVSYAAGDCREKSRVVHELLERSGFTSLHDSTLTPSTPWDESLYERLATCHAAVVLLTTKALTSEWVRREVDILLHRRAYLSGAGRDSDQPGFVVQPIVVDSVRTPSGENLDGTFRALLRLEVLKWEDHEQLIDVLEPVRSSVEYLDAEAEAEKWLAQQLKPLPEATLSKVHEQCRAQKLISDATKAWLEYETEHQQRARRVASIALSLPPAGAIECLAPLWREVGDTSLIVELLLPNWIRAESAASLRAVVEDQTHAVLRCSAEGVAYHHARRAERWPTPTWRWVPITQTHQGEDRLAALHRDVTRGLLKAMHLEEGEESMLAPLIDEERPVLIVYIESLIDEATLDQLRDSFPGVVFILGLDDTEQASIVGNLQEIRPAMMRREEQAGLISVRRARSRASSLLGGDPQ